MSQDRNGLSYKKIDLHVHTPASHDFINKDITEVDIINHCISIGLDAIAVTDHNTGEYIDRLKEKANGKITIIPGVEITCTGGISGIHIIGLFDITKGTADINALLSRLDILPVNFGKQETITGKSVNDVINEISNMGGLSVLAHCQSSKGVLHDMQGQQRISIIKNPNLYAAETSVQDFLDERKKETKKRVVDLLDGTDANYERKLAVYSASDSKKEGQDGHCLDGIGSQYSYFKTDDIITLESIRQCFIDSDIRIKQSFEEINYIFPYIKEVKVNSGFFKDQHVKFHSGLNTIIGPKGAGKSLLIEIMRFALNQPSKDIEINKDHLDKLNNKLGQYSEVGIKYVDKFGNENEIKKVYNSKAENNEEIYFPVLFLSQNEIIKTAESESKQIEFIDKFFDFTEYKIKINMLKNDLKTLDMTYAECITAYINNKFLEKNVKNITLEIKNIEKELKDPEYYLYKQKENAFKMSKLQESDFFRLEQFNKKIQNELENVIFNQIPSEILDINPELKRNKEKLENVKNNFRTNILDMENYLNSIRDTFNSEKETVEKVFKESAMQYEEKLKNKAIDFNIEKSRKEKEIQLSKLIEQQQHLKTQIDTIKTVREQRENKLEELDSVYKAYTEKRKEICNKFEVISNNRLKINLYEDSNKELFKEKLKQIKKGSYIRDDEIEKIANTMSSRDFVNELIRYHVTIENEAKDIKIKDISQKNKISYETIKTLFDFILKELKMIEILEMGYAYRAEDIPEIKLRLEDGRYEDINRVSIGQKCTAMLIIALSQGEMPVVIDQPEDSLDLKTIWDDMCNKIRDNKDKRQFIFTTHNSSLAVASDTDKYIVINSTANSGKIVNSGAIDTKEVKENVVDYLEGTEKTYIKKYKKYGFKF